MSTFYAILFIVATLVLVIGVARRVYLYYKVPAPLKIPTTPAPTTTAGVVMRMFREVVFFESLFKATKWTWLFGWMFHIGLALVLARHLRYFMDADNLFFPLVELIQPFGKYASFAMVAGLFGLLARRLFVDRVRYISSPSDYAMLLLLILIGLAGMSITFFFRTDIVALKSFFDGLWVFDWKGLPTDAALLIHLALVAILFLIFPVSKLLHAPGVFFSPTRNQVDNPREQRHIVDWARKLEEE